jgi:hypothetical protein
MLVFLLLGVNYSYSPHKTLISTHCGHLPFSFKKNICPL